jgi:hypothetical protein
MAAMEPAFGHREHIQLAWRELRAHEPGEALRRVEAAIRHPRSSSSTPSSTVSRPCSIPACFGATSAPS